MSNPVTSDPSAMGWLEGHAWAAMVWGLPASLLGVASYTLFNSQRGLETVLLWTALFLGACLRRRRQNSVMTVERMGRFWRVKFAGLKMVVPWLDDIVLNDDLQGKTVVLLADKLGKPEPTNFANGVTTVKADGWFQIAKQEDMDAQNWKAVRADVKRFTYRFKHGERGPRIADVFNDALRPLLGAKNIDEARGSLDEVSKATATAVADSLGELGVSVFAKKGVVIHAVDLTEEERKALEQRLEGTVIADKAANASRQYWEPFMQTRNNMRPGSKSKDFDINDPNDKALLAMYMQRQGLETIQSTDANITFFARDMDGVNSSVLVNHHAPTHTVTS